jgi:zinc transport system substrate-binding protein
MQEKKYKLLEFLLLVIIIGVGTSQVSSRVVEQPQDGRLTVTTSIYPIYFLAKEIGGDRAEVVNLTLPGVEPHDYELSPGDSMRLERSRIVFLNGGGLESWGADIQRTLDAGKTRIVTVGQGLTTQEWEDEGERSADPHIWLSPVIAVRMAETIRDTYSEIDPIHAEEYRARTEQLSQTLRQLDREYRMGLARCASREMVTTHAAFGYLASEYDLEQIPIAGLSPEAEPSPGELIELAKVVRERGVRYIFFESLVSPRLAETLARETGAQTLELNPLEGLTLDEQSSGATYITLMKSNLTHLMTALTCTP